MHPMAPTPSKAQNLGCFSKVPNFFLIRITCLCFLKIKQYKGIDKGKQLSPPCTHLHERQRMESCLVWLCGCLSGSHKQALEPVLDSPVLFVTHWLSVRTNGGLVGLNPNIFPHNTLAHGIHTGVFEVYVYNTFFNLSVTFITLNHIFIPLLLFPLIIDRMYLSLLKI